MRSLLEGRNAAALTKALHPVCQLLRSSRSTVPPIFFETGKPSKLLI